MSTSGENVESYKTATLALIMRNPTKSNRKTTHLRAEDAKKPKLIQL